jgi:hypothetical protein
MNSQLFSIGVFPWLMAGATTIFFPPQWPRWILNRLPWQKLAAFGQRPLAIAKHEVLGWTTRLVLAALAIHFAIQLVVPFRHHLYRGDASWTEEGHMFSWRMKLRDKRGFVRFVITDLDTGETWTRNPKEYLPRWQVDDVIMRPDLLWQHAQQLAVDYRAQGHPRVSVHVESSLSLNGRRPQPLIDPTVDLAAQPRPTINTPWIVPLREPLPTGKETVYRIMLDR